LQQHLQLDASQQQHDLCTQGRASNMRLVGNCGQHHTNVHNNALLKQWAIQSKSLVFTTFSAHIHAIAAILRANSANA
jgi:hypothetical protein